MGMRMAGNAHGLQDVACVLNNLLKLGSWMIGGETQHREAAETCPYRNGEPRLDTHRERIRKEATLSSRACCSTVTAIPDKGLLRSAPPAKDGVDV